MRYIVLLLPLLFIAATIPAVSQKKVKHDHVVTIATDLGEIKLLLYDETPLHKENFLTLVDEGYFDGTTFHRVIRNFMIQGGDPQSKPGGNAAQIGMGGPGYTIPAEIVPRFKHIKGAVAAARMGDQVNPEKESSGSQFYIVHNERGTPHLDGGYTVFGQVIDGLDVVDAIAAQRVSPGSNRPFDNIRMTVSAKKMKRKKVTKVYGWEY